MRTGPESWTPSIDHNILFSVNSGFAGGNDQTVQHAQHDRSPADQGRADRGEREVFGPSIAFNGTIDSFRAPVQLPPATACRPRTNSQVEPTARSPVQPKAAVETGLRDNSQLLDKYREVWLDWMPRDPFGTSCTGTYERYALSTVKTEGPPQNANTSSRTIKGACWIASARRQIFHACSSTRLERAKESTPRHKRGQRQVRVHDTVADKLLTN